MSQRWVAWVRGNREGLLRLSHFLTRQRRKHRDVGFGLSQMPGLRAGGPAVGPERHPTARLAARLDYTPRPDSARARRHLLPISGGLLVAAGAQVLAAVGSGAAHPE